MSERNDLHQKAEKLPMMKQLLSKPAEAYRRYREFKKRNTTYRVVNYSLLAVGSVYCVLLLFPQILFAHSLTHKNFVVYSRQPMSEKMVAVLDSAESKLLRSPIYKSAANGRLIFADSHGLYKFLTAEDSSMGSTIPFIGHSRINRHDLENDLVFRNGTPPNQRSLSGVIAHEVMHNQISTHLGFARYMRTPRWKDEGYCEYIAGETTLSFEEGLRRWREKPDDASGYAYFKYHQMVKYVLETEGVSVEELFTGSFDEKEVAEKTLLSISK